MDYSFYGGRRGAAFVITGRFRYTAADKITQRDMKLIQQEYGSDKQIKTLNDWKKIYCMKEAFSQGGNYTVVNYDEYVIIDSYNKNDPDNGKIYRRGYNYQDELGGAQYQGQIVGPGGMSPAVEMSTYDDVKNKADMEGYEVRHTSGEYKPTVNLVPGKKSDGTFNDSIKWQCCSVRDEFNKDTTAYVGFIFPYTVIEYTAATVSPYYNRNNDTENFVNQNLVDRIDDGAHPFYEKWDIKIPKGIKGDVIKNMRIMIANNSIENYPTKTIDIEQQREVVVYDEWIYDRIAEGEKRTYFVGYHNKIISIAIDDDGWMTVTYNSGEVYKVGTRINWIKNVEINTGNVEGEGNQKIKITYNNNSQTDIGNPLNYVMRSVIRQTDYHLLVLYSDPARRQQLKDEGIAASYDGRDDWFDLGSVKCYDGVLFGLNLPISTFPSLKISDIRDELNQLYPNGLEGAELQGKLITVGDDNDIKDIFAFDYSYNEEQQYKGWYYLGTTEEPTTKTVKMCVIAGTESDDNVKKLANDLPIGSIWFVSDNEIPFVNFDLEYAVPLDKLCLMAGTIEDESMATNLVPGSIWLVIEE